MPMRQVKTEAGTLTYELCRKRVKNLNLRVRADGSIAVSAPAGVAVAAVDEFVRRKAGWIAQVEQKLADTAAPQGIYCLCELPREEAFSLDPKGRYMLLVSLQDPGNVGTIVRSCEAFGITGLFVTGDCPDLYSPKVLRSTMGSAFRLPVESCADPIQLAEEMKSQGISVFGAALNADSRPLSQLSLGDGCCIAIGNEGNGLPEDFLTHCTGSVVIEMRGRAESLNAAAAASILAYALTNG